MNNDKIRIAGKALLARLTGFSLPFLGASWTPPVDERDRAQRLLIFLSDRRALFQPFNIETEILVANSVLELRKRLVADLENVKTGSPLGNSLAALAAACRKFLTDIGAPEVARHHPYRHFGEERGEFFQSLGELRAFFGIHLAAIGAVYGLPIEGELTTILPPEIEKSKLKRKRKGAAS